MFDLAGRRVARREFFQRRRLALRPASARQAPDSAFLARVERDAQPLRAVARQPFLYPRRFAYRDADGNWRLRKGLH